MCPHQKTPQAYAPTAQAEKGHLKTSGHEAYYEIMGYMALQVLMGGNQYLSIRKVK